MGGENLLTLFFFSRIILSMLGFLKFHMNFRINCQFVQRSLLVFLIRIVLNLQIGLGSTTILPMVKSFSKILDALPFIQVIVNFIP